MDWWIGGLVVECMDELMDFRWMSGRIGGVVVW